MGVSRPVGRVLCARSRGPAVIHLGLPLPAASCGLPASIGRAALNRSRRPAPLAANAGPLDLAPGGVYRAAAVTCGAGGLLHHRFTLTVAARKRPATAVCFLWHCPAGHPGSVLPTTLPCGARTFLTGPRTHGPARPPGRLALHPRIGARAPAAGAHASHHSPAGPERGRAAAPFPSAARSPAASMASLASRSACLLRSRGTQVYVTRPSARAAWLASAARARRPGFLIFQRPDICSTTSLESIRTSVAAPRASLPAARRPAS